VTVVSQHVPRPRFRGLRALIKEARQRQRRRHVLLALVLIVAAGAASTGYAISNAASGSVSASACAASQCATAGSSAAGIPNPCILLTNAEAATALGASGIQDRNSQLPSGMATSHYRMCTWKGTPLNNAFYSDNTVTVLTYKSTRARFMSIERVSHGVIRGLGEAAYGEGGAATMVFVFQRGSVIQIQVSPAVNPLQAEIKLARRALTRLP
jgi:hypothetical protein